MATTVNFAVLHPGSLITDVAATYITGLPASQTQIKRAVFVNTTATPTTITAWRIANGGTADITNEIIPQRPIAALATDLAPELAGMVLNAGDTIACEAGVVATVNFFASGIVAT